MYRNWKESFTLGGKEKPFLWLYDGEKITIRISMKNNNELENTFLNSEIDILMSYIKQSGKVTLADNVTKIQDGTEKDGIGKFIYNNIIKDIGAAQAASQLVSIFHNTNILHFNGRKRNMEFWVSDFNWKEKILSYLIKMLSYDNIFVVFGYNILYTYY